MWEKQYHWGVLLGGVWNSRVEKEGLLDRWKIKSLDMTADRGMFGC
jgi:hypothetical protein